MIIEKNLGELTFNVKFREGECVTLDVIKDDFIYEAEKCGFPVAFYEDKVQVDRNFTEDCLVLHHPEHKDDYFKSCIRVKCQGSYAFVTVNDFGRSVRMGRVNQKNFLKETMGEDSGLTYKVGAFLGVAFSGGLKRVDKKQLEEEQMWYVMVSDTFEQLFGLS